MDGNRCTENEALYIIPNNLLTNRNYNQLTKMTKNNPETLTEKNSLSVKPIQRRQFLQFAGASALAVGIISCKKQTYEAGTPSVNDGITIDFKSDTGLLNFIYALEQLEASFYSKIAESVPATFSALQQTYLSEIQLHEIAHREFFKRYLGIAGIKTLEFDFSSIDFTTKESVLTAAKTFEDLGVAAYNGVIAASKELATIVLAGQISSIEARHAAWIRNQIVANSASDLNELNNLGAVAADGLDVVLTPTKVLEQASKYIKTKLTIINL
jgi:hypothetical protein